MAIDPPLVKSLFLAAAQLADPAERAAYLDNACDGDAELRARVEALLQAAAAAPPPAAPEGPTKAHVPDPAETGAAGVQVGMKIAGKYTLVERIGEGGMGSVWRAKQTEPVKRYVAVKLIKAGMDSKQVLARFEAERQALALMDHPHIARVLDGGLHEARPYFVMELVNGVPITNYCDTRKLTPRERLELFVPVCQAIQHAHQKGIIHRDIKPSNVLIASYDDKPVVKVIDFGVAKATGGTLTEATIETGFGGVVGTPEYMSPEQATFNNLDIDTRSDVYGLGVLLYELLTGSPPFAKKELEKQGFLEILRVVREEEPPRPSTKLSTAEALPTLSANRGTEPRKLTALLRNELDWIVMKALEKDRTRRYETANGFAADVLRYLSGEAVQAHPPSTAYRMKKFVQRHRGQVIATSLVLLALLAGMAGTTWGLIEARRAQGRAEAAATAERTAKDAEAVERAKAETEKKKAIEFRNKALEALQATTGEDVEKLLGARTELSAKERAYLEAIAGRWQAFARQEGTDEQTRAVQAEGHFRVAYLWQKLGRREEAWPEYERAVSLREKLVVDFPTVPDHRHDLAVSHHNLGFLLGELGKPSEAEGQYQKALAICERLVTDFPTIPNYRRYLATVYNNLGTLLKNLGKRAEAEEQYQKALAIREKLAAEFPTVPDYRNDLAGSHHNLGLLQADLGKRAEAEEPYRKALAILEKLVTDFPTVPDYRRSLATVHNNLGRMLAGLAKRLEAEKEYGKALAILEKLAAEFPTVPDYHIDLAISHNNLGLLQADLGKRAEAEEQYEKALAFQEKLATDFSTVPWYRIGLGGTYCNLGNLQRDSGKPADSLAWYQKAIDMLRPVHEQEARDVTAKCFLRNSYWGRARAHDRLKQYAEAVKDWDRAIPLSETGEQPQLRAGLATSHHNLAFLLAGLGKRAEAEEEYRTALAIRETLATDFPTVPDSHRDLARSHNSLGFLLAGLGKPAEAKEHYHKALAIQEKLVTDFPKVPDNRRDLALSQNNLGVLLANLGKRSEAEEQYQKALAIRERLAADFPKAPGYRIDLGGTYLNFGNVQRNGDKPADSMAWYQKAIDTLRSVEEPNPRDGTAKLFLRNSYWGRARAYDRLQQYSEAVKDWDRAIPLCAAAEQPTFRTRRALSQVRTAHVAEAVAEVATLTKMPSWSASQWYDFACVYALACHKVPDKKPEYANRALELLHKAVTAGYKNATQMKSDGDLDPLRDRDDFKKLLAELEAKDGAEK